jgi:hypothetical protein
MIASLLLTALFALNPGVKIPSPIETIARDLVVNLTTGHFEEATKDFSDTLRTTASPAGLADSRQQLQATVGGFRGIKETRQGRDNGFRFVDVIVKYEKSDVAIRVVFDAYDHVGAVYLDPIVPPKVDPILEAIARAFFASFTAGDFEAASKEFDPGMHAQLPPPALEKLTRQVAENFGAYREVTAVEQRFVQGLRIIDLTAKYEKSTVQLSVIFNVDGKVTGVRLGPLQSPKP